MPSAAPGDRPSSVLVWLTGALGDTLLGFPALRALRHWAPRARIAAAGNLQYLDFALRDGLIDAVIDQDGRAGAALAAGLPNSGIELPQLAVIWSSAARQIANGLLEAGAQAVVASAAHAADARHQSRYLLDCLRPLGVPKAIRAVPSPVLPLSRHLLLYVAGTGDRLVLLHPGAGSPWKRWPIAAYLRLAATLRASGARVRWSFGPADQALRAEVAEDPACRAEAWPELPLQEFSALLGRCDLLVSADCGVTHLAALVGTPQITLFGPTDPRRWRPISRKARILTAPALCGGVWERVGSRQPETPFLQRCVPHNSHGCRCLAYLPVEVVAAACEPGSAQNSPPGFSRSSL